MRSPILRLAFGGFRRRLPGAVLMTVLVMAAAATATMAWNTATVAGEPWERTFEQTNGAHVLVHGGSADVAEAASGPGVVEAAGPVPGVFTSFSRGERYALHVVGLGAEPPSVERPVVTEGRWLRSDGEVVLERSFARTLEIAPGEELLVKTTTGELEATVVGLAVIAAGEPYPDSQPGVAFGTPRLVEQVQPDPSRRGSILALRLADPAMARAVAFDILRAAPQGERFVSTWLDRQETATNRNRVTSIVLTTFSIIELVTIGMILAAIVASRVLARSREIGLLKAVGFTPRQVALVFVVEQAAVAVVGAIAGVVIGALLTPVLVRRSTELVGAVPVDVDPLRLAVVVVGVGAVVSLVSAVPSLRGGRRTVVHGLQVAHGAAAGSSLARLVALGRFTTARLGLKQALARPGRSAATAVALALTASALVAGLAMESTLSHEEAVEAAAARTAPFPEDPAGLLPATRDPVFAGDPTRDQVRPIVHGLNALVLAIAVGSLFGAAALSVRERSRELGILKAIGLAPRQLGGSVLTAHGALGVLAAGAGLPLGLGLFVGVYWLANGTTDLVRLPPWWQLALVPLASTLLILAVVAWPAHRAARLPVVQALRYE